MMQHPHVRHRTWWAVATAVALVAIAGCGGSGGSATATSTTGGNASPSSTSAVSAGAASGGITSTTITIGQIADVSGPIPGLFTGAVDALDAWAAYVNSTGGIDGRKVVIDHKDSALNCNVYSNELKGLTSSVFASVGSYSGVDECGEAALKAAPGFSDIQAGALAPTLYSLPNVVVPSPQPPGEATTTYQWVKDKYGLAAVQKTASLYDSTVSANYQQSRHAAESIGYKYIYTRGFGNTEQDFTSDILRMKADGVKIVDEQTMPLNQVANFLKQAQQQGFKPEAIVDSQPYNAQFFKLLGDSAAAAPVVIPIPTALYLGQDSGTVPEITTLHTWLNKTHPGYQPDLFATEAWAAGLLFQDAMKKAGGTPSRATLLAALHGTTNFDANGLLGPAGPGTDTPTTCFVLAGVHNGKYVRLEPPTTGFDCQGTFVRAAS